MAMKISGSNIGKLRMQTSVKKLKSGIKDNPVKKGKSLTALAKGIKI